MQQHTSGALEVKGKTIAVLGNGPKVIFPPENKEIYTQILENGGAIVSEYPGDTPSGSEKFRQRNRIVSGLSVGILVVEAEFISGTSITARFAKKQGKNIFCIPSSIDNKKGMGANILIQKGATLVLRTKEIIEKYIENIRYKQISIQDLEKSKTPKIDLSKIKKDYRSIYEMIANNYTVNDISKKLNLSLSEIYEKLFMMEMDRLIESYQGQYKIKNEE